MKKAHAIASVMAILLMAFLSVTALATDAEIYFCSDSEGQNKVTDIDEGDKIYIAVYDPDENISCDLPDKIWTDIKIMDPKTGAYIVWVSYKDENGDADADKYNEAAYDPYQGHDPGTAGSTDYDYLEETGDNTGLFVSNRAFQVGTREAFATDYKNTHVVCKTAHPDPEDTVTGAFLQDFQWGHYLYDGEDGGVRGWFDDTPTFTSGVMPWSYLDGPVLPSGTSLGVEEGKYLVGRFENMDTLVGMYQDPNEASDVATTMGKISDTEASISWSQDVYADGYGSAKITINDPDENLNCDIVEYVPVFVIVNPGSWDAEQTHSATTFCELKRYGGVDPSGGGSALFNGTTEQIRWYNIYDSGLSGVSHVSSGTGDIVNSQDTSDGAYYLDYSTAFDTTDTNGYARVSFYARETGPDTGEFTISFSTILDKLGFDSLAAGDVLAAYYLDPNDFDDFKLATASIETDEHLSTTRFTDVNRTEKSEFWIGQDRVYVWVLDYNANTDSCAQETVQVHICDPHGEDDSETYTLSETGLNSAVFFSSAGIELLPVWNGLGTASGGSYQLSLNNGKIEAFNEDSIYARYNDLEKTNDISFATMEVADTQVYDGATDTVKMYFLNKDGNRVSRYGSDDFVRIEVIDPDQNENTGYPDTVKGFWDGGQNYPFGPEHDPTGSHAVNDLLGLENICTTDEHAKIYVLNPSNGKWCEMELKETGNSTGVFKSVTAIPLQVKLCPGAVLASLAEAGDTLIAVYQDPSNHSDSAWISIKVSEGGSLPAEGEASTTEFVDADGEIVANYTEGDSVYVMVTDGDHIGDSSLTGLQVEGTAFELSRVEDADNEYTFMTEAISMTDLGVVAGDTITAEYTDPTDETDTSSDEIDILAVGLTVDNFSVTPNPFTDEAVFSFEGSGTAISFSVTIYDLSGKPVFIPDPVENVTSGEDAITWDGHNDAGALLANGPYICVIVATGTDVDGISTITKTQKGTVFINR